MRDEEDASRVWLHTELGLLPACARSDAQVALHAPALADVHAVARAYFRQEAFERELARRLPSAYVAEIEPTAPAHVTVALRGDEEPLLEGELQGLALTHLRVRCPDDAHLAATARILADHAQGWTLEADGVLELACLPMPTWRTALRMAALLAQVAAAVDAAPNAAPTI